MMITESTIRSLVEEKLEGTDLFIVSVRVMPTNRIRVYIDSLEGLDVRDCVNVSRHIEGNLDREVEDYELEVSSPGLTEPYQHPLQYRKNVGREVKVATTDGRNLKGKLTAFDGENITIEPEKKKKKEETGPITLPLSEIKEAKTVISFK
ncbi:MAG: ribosome assembly cofactor RimP [Flavobacteriales bacterium]|nr:ribosome assembly cofactor RimP [Flavobacteriales bacterium]